MTPCPTSVWARLVPVALAVLTCVGGSVRAADQLKVEGKTVELPDFNVTDSRLLPEPAPWRYGRVGNFEVLSSASERATRKLLADFGRFQRALTLLWPAPLRSNAGSALLLCARPGEFATLLPPGSDAKGAALPSRLLRDRELTFIAADLAAERAAVLDSADALANDAAVVEIEFDHATLLYREYIFSLLQQSEARAPVWMAEGLAQIVMDAEITDRWLIYGKVNTFKGAAVGGGQAAEATDASANSTAVVGNQPFNYVLRNRELMPLADFFAVGADSPEARAPLGNNLWAKQAYLFVHYCLFGENLRYRDALVQFVGRLAREPLSEALFKEVFQVDYRTMQRQLESYLRHVRHKYQSYELKPGDRFDPKTVELDTASAAQIGRLLGDAQRLAGNLSTAGETYRTAYLRGSRDPVLLAGLAITEGAAGHADRAAKFLDAACAAKVERPSAHAALARRRLEAALAAPGAKLEPAALAGVLTAVFEARKHPPLIPETYHVAAAAWAASTVPAKPANLAVLDEGLKAFPRDSALVLKGAELYAAAGAPDIAASIARMGLRFAADADARAKFEQLLATLPAAPAAK